MNKSKILTIIIILVIVSTLTFIGFASKNKKENSIILNNNQSEKNVPIFFYGNTCPHCKEVEEWMVENKVEEKIEIIKKEVYDNQQNAQELTQTAKKCGLPTNSIGVPFLFAEGKCLIGTPDITSFLSQKAGIKESTESAERSEK